MKLFEKLFTRRNTVTPQPTLAHAESRLAALQAELAEARQAIADAVASEETHMGIETLTKRVMAAGAIRDAASARETQARNAAVEAANQARVNEILTRVAGKWTPMLWDLAELRELAVDGTIPGVDLEALYGLPHDFARRVTEALYGLTPNANWHVDFLNGEPNLPPTPKRRHVVTIRQVDATIARLAVLQ